MKTFGVVLFTALALSTSAGGLSMTVQENGVRVEGVSRGGQIVVYSYSKIARDGRTYGDAHTTLLDDDDHDGTVVLETSVALRSVWVAIDTSSAAIAYGAREQFPLVVRDLSPNLLRKDAAGELAGLEMEIPRLVLLVVRPGKGAWIMRGQEGTTGDHDATANGKLSFLFEDAISVLDKKDKAPKFLKAGDILAAVDPGHLDIFVGQVSK